MSLILFPAAAALVMLPLANQSGFGAPTNASEEWAYVVVLEVPEATPPMTGADPVAQAAPTPSALIPATPEPTGLTAVVPKDPAVIGPRPAGEEAGLAAPTAAPSPAAAIIDAAISPLRGLGAIGAGPFAKPRPPRTDPELFERLDAGKITLAIAAPPERAYSAPLGTAPDQPLIEVIVAPPVTGAAGSSVAIPRPKAVIVAVSRSGSGGVVSGGGSSGGGGGGGWSYAIASWYGPGFYGNRTACGQTYTTSSWGVAHKSLPCGTMLQFMHNGRVVSAPVIDRGPYIAGRTFDLSAALCRALGHCWTGGIRWRYR